MGYYRSDATGKLTKYAGSNNRGYMPLGMIFASSVELEELTVKCLNGQNLSINGPYNQFCYWLMDKGSKAPTCDIATYATEMASYGQCGKYVINNTATAQTSGNYTVPAYSIKLPTITEFVASNNGGDAIGLAELDMFKSHAHDLYVRPAQYTGNWTNGHYSGGYVPKQIEGNYYDGSGTTPTGGEETRPKNIRYPFYVVVAQGVRLQALVDMEKMAEKDASNLSEGDVERWREKLNKNLDYDVLWNVGGDSEFQNFAAREVTLPTLYNYKMIAVMFRLTKITNTEDCIVVANVELNRQCVAINLQWDTILRRIFTCTSNGIRFKEGQQITAYGTSGPVTNENCMVPIYIFGLK